MIIIMIIVCTSRDERSEGVRRLVQGGAAQAPYNIVSYTMM